MFSVYMPTKGIVKFQISGFDEDVLGFFNIWALSPIKSCNLNHFPFSKQLYVILFS